MARELSQEEVLDFLCQGGGKVANASLLGHFKSFLRDPQAPQEQLQKHRDRFKRYVNSVAVVKQEGAVKYVVLKSRYRDLLGEELRPSVPPEPDNREDGIRGDSRGVHPADNLQEYKGPLRGQSDARHIYGRDHGQQQGEWLGHREIPVHSLPESNETEIPELTASVNGNKWEAPTQRAPSPHPLTPQPTYTAPIRPIPPQVSSPPAKQSPQNTSFINISSPPAKHPTKTTSSRNSSSPPAKYPTKTTSSLNSSSSSSSPAQSSDLPKVPTPDPSGPWRHPPGGEGRPEAANPASVTCSRDLKEQRQGYISHTEFNPPNPRLNGRYPQEVHFAHEEHNKYVYSEQHSDIQYLERPDCPSSYYKNPEHPSPSSLLPQEQGFTPPDVLLEDYPPPSPTPSPPLHHNDMHGMWMYEIPIFKSIRYQLSLQDLEDFVDQESCGSDGSDSGEGGDCDTEHRDEEDLSSDSNNQKCQPYIEQKFDLPTRHPPSKKFLSIIEQYNKPQTEDSMGVTDIAAERNINPLVAINSKESPYIAKSFLTDQAPILFDLALSHPKNRIYSNLRENMSSSDDELIDRDYRKRRRPSRTKKPPNLPVAAPSPDIDRLLFTKSVTNNSFIINDYFPVESQMHIDAQNVSEGQTDSNLKRTIAYKSSSVPLDQMEHDWIVKSASGSWLQVYGMFNMDPNLALRKDFISGYTVLHWFAKHGCVEMFQKFVTGAKKAGIELDINVKTSCGYTPLHIAAIHGHSKVATLLVENLKVNVKLRDNSGKRAWQYLSCRTSGEVWQLLGAPKGKTIFPSRALPVVHNLNSHYGSSQINRKTSLAAFLKPQHQKWKANNLHALREREIYSD
ncbi:ankyrin repeat domain-containing SOWAHB [Pelobates cultripes]|uniref:Ankyrin repeat domain-containing SOWAHB n=1 Tax=Pelobates cultripes TaxID=61616 RepID=A0AAD1WA52_PELCU|nr:ankyrin repeat domain-containing SOWAHB [Pelobates cultripes]